MESLDWIRQKRPKGKADDRPFVTLTFAQTLDGFIGENSASTQPISISCPESMQLTHALRATHDAILVGIGTILSDNPRLNCRLVPRQQPDNVLTTFATLRPVVLDSLLKCPLDANVMAYDPILFCLHPRHVHHSQLGEFQARQQGLVGKNISIVYVEPTGSDSRLNIKQCLATLYSEFHIRSVMIEGGQSVIQSLLSQYQDLVDWLVITVSPQYRGHGVHVTNNTISNPIDFEGDYTKFGNDVILSAVLRVEKNQ